MQTRWLQDFLALSETRNFTRAAAKRSISQAAFSRRIQSLEGWLGTTLVERGGGSVNLTRSGRLFEIEARELLARIQSSRVELSGLMEPGRRKLTISMSQTVATTRFPTLWKTWCAGLQVDLTTHIGNIGDAVADFITGHSDLLLCHQSREIPVSLDVKSFSVHVVETDRLVPVVAKDSALAERLGKAGNWDSVPMVLYAPNRYFARLVRSLMEQTPIRISGPAVVQTEMADVVCNCVEQDMGVGWLPRSLYKQRPSLDIIEEPTLAMPLEIVAVMNKDSNSQPAHEIWRRISRVSAV